MEEITPKDRSTLREYFRANAVPTQSQFWQFIESTLNPVEDGLTKTNGSALSIRPANTPGRQVVELYKRFDDGTPTWTIELQPQSGGVDRPGLNIRGAGQTTALYLKEQDGSVGLGTVTPEAHLQVTAAGSDTWRHDDLRNNLTLVLGQDGQASPGSFKLYGGSPGEYAFIREAQGGFYLDNTSGEFVIGRDNGVRAFVEGQHPPTVLRLMNGDEERIRLHTTGNSFLRQGNFGIGTSHPLAPLHVESGANASAGEAGSGAVLIGDSNATHLALDGNSIHAKQNGTSVGTLGIQPDGGLTQIGGNLEIHGVLDLHQDLEVDGNLLVRQNLTLNGNLDGGTGEATFLRLKVHTDSEINGQLKLDQVEANSLTVRANLQLDGQAMFGQQPMFANGIAVQGAESTFQSPTRFQMPATFQNRIEAFEQVMIHGDLQLYGPLYAGGAEVKNLVIRTDDVAGPSHHEGGIHIQFNANGEQLAIDHNRIVAYNAQGGESILYLTRGQGVVDAGALLHVGHLEVSSLQGHDRVETHHLIARGDLSVAGNTQLADAEMGNLRVDNLVIRNDLAFEGNATIPNLSVGQLFLGGEPNYPALERDGAAIHMRSQAGLFVEKMGIVDWSPVLTLGDNTEAYTIGTGAGELGISTPDKPHAFTLKRDGKLAVNYIGYEIPGDFVLKGRMDVIADDEQFFGRRDVFEGFSPFAEIVLSSPKSNITIASTMQGMVDDQGSSLNFACREEFFGDQEPQGFVFSMDQLRYDFQGHQASYQALPGSRLGFYLWHKDHGHERPFQNLHSEERKRIPFCIDAAKFRVGLGTSEPNTRMDIWGRSNLQGLQMLIKEAYPGAMESEFNQFPQDPHRPGGAAIGFSSELFHRNLNHPQVHPEEVSDLMAQVGIHRRPELATGWDETDALVLKTWFDLPIRMKINNNTVLQAATGPEEHAVFVGEDLGQGNPMDWKPTNLHVTGEIITQKPYLHVGLGELFLPMSSQWMPIWFWDRKPDGSPLVVEFFNGEQNDAFYLKITAFTLNRSNVPSFWKMECFQSDNANMVAGYDVIEGSNFHVVWLRGGPLRWRSNRPVVMFGESHPFMPQPPMLPTISALPLGMDGRMFTVQGGALTQP